MEDINFRMIPSKEFGHIREDRLQFAKDKKLVVYDYDLKDYIITKKAMNTYTNFFQWITGNVEELVERVDRYTEQKKKEEDEETMNIFNGM